MIHQMILDVRQTGLGKPCRPRSDYSWRSSLIRVYTVCNSICIFWTHKGMVKQHGSNFSKVTLLGCQNFSNFQSTCIMIMWSSCSTACSLQSAGSSFTATSLPDPDISRSSFNMYSCHRVRCTMSGRSRLKSNRFTTCSRKFFHIPFSRMNLPLSSTNFWQASGIWQSAIYLEKSQNTMELLSTWFPPH